MPESTRDQNRAQKAFDCVTQIKNVNDNKLETDYKRFSKRFPSLVSGCGLVQAVAFAEVKKHDLFLTHLADVMGESSKDTPAPDSRGSGLLVLD
jgi:CRISPR type III-B/RAMP module-associated protein Cmr5